MSHIDPTLIEAGLVLGSFIGGALGGILGGYKLSARKNNGRVHASSELTLVRNEIEGLRKAIENIPVIERSKKTSGALHISEEGLQKHDDLRTLLTEKYITIDTHTLLCERTAAKFEKGIADALKNNNTELLKILKDNGVVPQ